MVWDVSYFPPLQGCPQSRPKHTLKLPHLHVLRPGSLRKKVQHTAAVVNTGDSYVFYFGIYMGCSGGSRKLGTGGGRNGGGGGTP